MKHLVRLAIISFSFVVLVASCKSTNKITTAIAKKDTVQRVIVQTENPHLDSLKYIHDVLGKLNGNHINFTTFSAKIKVNYKDKEGEQPELTVILRMQKDSAIWLSINATIFSYEAFRVLITRDSVKVLNKKEKVAQFRSVNYLQELTQLPFNFSTLQDIFLGNPIYLDSNVVSYRKNDQNILLMNIGELFKHLVTISNNDYLLQHSKLDDVDPIRNRTCDLTYSGYENKSGVKFATERRISVSEKSKLDIDMDFKQYSFNETLDLRFPIPKNYKRQ
jgi:hypothetical protein